MKRYGVLIGCGCLLGMMSACTPADTRPADIQAVKAVEAAWAKDAALKDPAKFVGYYSVDAALLIPNAPIFTGRDDIEGAVASLMADPNFALSFQGTQAVASQGGDMVYTVGTYSLTLSDPEDKQPVTDKGKYLTVYKKQPDGTWKAVADMLNSDLPAPGAAH
jgi:ketosteroid isomerase-like protein